LKAQIDTLQAQVDQLSKAQTQPVLIAPAQAVQAGDKPRTWKIPGTDTSLQIGGYVKGDLTYDFGPSNQIIGDSFGASAIPSAGATRHRDGSFRAHARQSRVWIRTWTPSPLGEIETHIQGDFFGGGGNEIFSNSSAFRLRHAYGRVGGLLVGQTWTNFMALASYPDTVDFFGPTGMPFLRQGQIRYTFNSGPMKISVSAENPELRGTSVAASALGAGGGGSASTAANVGLDKAPDLTAAVKYSGEGYTLRLAGVLRALKVDDGGANAPAKVNDSDVGYGLHASATVNTFGDDTLMLNFGYGDGGGRYMHIPGGIFGAVNINAANNINTIKTWATVIGYEHHWNSDFKSVVAWGHTNMDDVLGPKSNFQVDTIHGNLWWNLAPRKRAGLEVVYGRNELAAANNDTVRLNAAIQFFF